MPVAIFRKIVSVARLLHSHRNIPQTIIKSEDDKYKTVL